MPVHPKQVCFAAGSSGQSIRATIVEYNTTTGAYDAVDISTATGLQLVFKTPTADGAKEIVKTAILINGGTDGKLGYTVDADLFNAVKNPRIVGVWRYKPKLVLGTWTGSAVEWSSFRVVE